MKTEYKLYPIGIIRKKSDDEAIIEISKPFKDALLGLEGYSHLVVCYWFHKNDTPEKRKTLQVHPRKDEKNPLTGVFGTHSPVRPNLIAISYCKNLSIQNTTIFIDNIDAIDGTPVIDIKPYIPVDKLMKEEIEVPGWV